MLSQRKTCNMEYLLIWKRVLKIINYTIEQVGKYFADVWTMQNVDNACDSLSSWQSSSTPPQVLFHLRSLLKNEKKNKIQIRIGT